MFIIIREILAPVHQSFDSFAQVIKGNYYYNPFLQKLLKPLYEINDLL